MPETVEITRYPNRRLYDHRGKHYINLGEINDIILRGDNVCIRDKKSGEDVTRMFLLQLLLERHPERAKLFPTSFLHEMLRADQMALDWLSSYFGQAQQMMKQANPAAGTAWPAWDFWQSMLGPTGSPAPGRGEPTDAAESPSDSIDEHADQPRERADQPGENAEQLSARVAELERRLKEIEGK